MAVIRSDGVGTTPVVQTGSAKHTLPAGDPRLDAISRLNRLEIGQQFRAEVVSRLDNGNSLVKLADTVVQMNMPRNVPVGERVSLTLIAKEPRPTFLYESSGGVQSSLSTAGRTIDAALRMAAQAQAQGTMPSLVGRTPLVLSSASMLVPQLAASLQQAIVQSGLFYESHLLQWMLGQKSIEQLQQEPQAQMKLPDEAPDEAADKNMQAQSRQGAAQQAQQSPAQRSGDRVYVIIDGDAKGKEVARVVLGDQKTETVMDKQAAQMIRMQLDALEHRRILWRGELWPGQELEWAISEDTPGRRNEEYLEESQRSWQSALRLELPLLGKLAVNMTLTGDQLQVYVETENQDVAGFMRSRGERLVTALRDAGANLDYLTVRDGSTDGPAA